MKAYQVVENGKPLEAVELETPTPTGAEILLKTIATENNQVELAHTVKRNVSDCKTSVQLKIAIYNKIRILTKTR